MIKHMRHIEMHVVESLHDFSLAEIAGLDVYEEETCEECFEKVGELELKFIPFVVLLDEESEWIVCMECAKPVL